MKLTELPTEGNLLTQDAEVQKAFAAAQVEEHRKDIEAFKDFSASKGLRLTNDNFFYIPAIGVVASAPAILEHLTGGITRERDGVISFAMLSSTFQANAHQPGYFRESNFMMMAHPYFRRGMHGINNFAPRFVDLFWEFENNDVTKYIAMDENRVRVNVDDSSYVELDTWYGPSYDDNISKIQNEVGKLRPPMDLNPHHVSSFFADAYCLDFQWSQKGRIKTFQALEFKSEQSYLMLDGKKYFPARYVHAEFDLDSGAFRHFDGAVQFYTKAEYDQRRDSNFNHNVKSQTLIKPRSEKLFKFNGKLRTEHWVEFCSHFFAGNPLMFEYFTGNYPEHVTDAINNLREGHSSKAAVHVVGDDR